MIMIRALSFNIWFLPYERNLTAEYVTPFLCRDDSLGLAH